MSIEEFQDIRRKEIADEENRKYHMLKEEIRRLDEFYLLVKKENDRIEEALSKEGKQEAGLADRFAISEEIKKSQTLFDSLNQELTSAEKTRSIKRLFESIKEVKNDNQALMKEFLEEKEMEQYLKWEREKLTQQYKAARDELSNCRKAAKKPSKIPLFERPVSR